MIGIVWGSTQQIANEKLEEVKNNYLSFGNNPVVEVEKCYFETQNGDVWRALAAIDLARGYRCNISYIDKQIPQEIVETIIYPSTTAGPYQAYNYYN